MTRARDLANIADGTFTATDLDLSGTLTVSGDATFDTNTLFVDVSANNVGIGTTSPAASLHVVSGATTTALIQSSAVATTLAINNTHANAWGSNLAIRTGGVDSGYFGTIGSLLGSTSQDLTVYATAGNGFRVYTNGNNERMRIDSSGNVQIKSGNEVQLYRADNGVAVDLYNGGSGVGLVLDDNNGDGFQFKFAGSEKMRIDSSGNLLVGRTTSDGYRVALAGSSQATSGLQMTYDSVQAGTITITSNSAMAFGLDGSDGSTERMRIDSSGTLYVGATGSHLISKLNVVQPSNNIAGYIYASASTGYTSTVFIAQGNQSTTNESYTIADFINSNASGRCKIYDSGDVDNTNGAYGSLSDVKLKTDIADAGSQWDDIKAIRFRKYKMIADPEQRVQMGVIAQELEEAGMSGLVRETADKDIEGNDLGTTTKSVKYSILYTKAVKALQEAMTRIETLEAEVAALKGA